VLKKSPVRTQRRAVRHVNVEPERSGNPICPLARTREEHRSDGRRLAVGKGGRALQPLALRGCRRAAYVLNALLRANPRGSSPTSSSFAFFCFSSSCVADDVTAVVSSTGRVLADGRNVFGAMIRLPIAAGSHSKLLAARVL